MTVEFLRTPDAAYQDLPGFEFAPHYIDDLPGYEGLRAHYVDEGDEHAQHTFLCLHGQPSWSYLYRKMIPVFVESGARVIAPDFFGFGKSDKPVDDDVYTFGFHRNFLKALIDALDLKNVTLVCQDWGGLLGLTLPVDYPQRIKRMIVMNTAIAVGKPAGKGFDEWRAYANSQPDLDVAALMRRAVATLSDTEAAAYGAPFPTIDYKAGVRRFPRLVMTDPGMEGVDVSLRAADFLANSWRGQCFMAVGVNDPVLGLPAMKQLRASISGASELMIVEDGGHFVQEVGEPIARAAIAYFNN